MLKNTALITGASKRIGKEMAMFLAKKNYDLILHHNFSKQEALNLQTEIVNQYPVKCHLVSFDLLNTRQVEDSAQIFADFPINLLINNASIFPKSQFLNQQQWHQLADNLNIHLTSPLILTKHFAYHCRQKKIPQAQIINMLDKNIARFDTSHFFYLLSKKFLAEATKMLALELAPHIRVNAIAPGFILSSVNEKNPQAEQEKIAKLIPLKNIGNPNNINSALDFLLNNNFITGQIIFVDGGASLNHAG
jgi:pteridine reductase